MNTKEIIKKITKKSIKETIYDGEDKVYNKRDLPYKEGNSSDYGGYFSYRWDGQVERLS